MTGYFQKSSEPDDGNQGQVFLDQDENEMEIILEDDQRSPMEEEEDSGEEEDSNHDTEEEEEGDRERKLPEGPCFLDHSDAVYSIAIGPHNEDKLLLATGGGDDNVRLWTFPDYLQVKVLQGHKDSVTSVKFNLDKTLIASGSMDNTVRIWKISGELLYVLDGPSDIIEWIEWHSQGNVILAGSADGSTWMWNGQTGQFMNSFFGHTGKVLCGSFTVDGKQIITGSEDGTIKIWDPKSAACLQTIEGKLFHESPIVCLAPHPSGQKLVLSGGEDGSVRLSNYETGKILSKLPSHTESVEAVTFVSSLPAIVSAGMDGNMFIYDIGSNVARSAIKQEEGFTKIIPHHLEPLLYSTDTSGKVMLIDCRSGAIIQQWKFHTDAILDIDVSIDGKVIATCSDDSSGHIIHIRS